MRNKRRRLRHTRRPSSSRNESRAPSLTNAAPASASASGRGIMMARGHVLVAGSWQTGSTGGHCQDGCQWPQVWPSTAQGRLASVRARGACVGLVG